MSWPRGLHLQVLYDPSDTQKRKDISLETAFGPGIGALGLSVVLTDRNRLNQIITNVSSKRTRFRILT